MPRQRPETRARVRKKIEEAALGLLADRGFEATGMRDVANACGMSAAALYNHYESKEALFAALVESYRGRVLDEAEDNPLREYLRDCRFPDDIPALAEALEQVVTRDKLYLHLWYVDLMRFSGRHFRNQLAPTLLLEDPGLKTRLAELAESTDFRHDPEMAFKLVYVHLFNFFLVLHVFDDGKFVGGDEGKKRYLATLEDVFLHGLVATA
jgi:AcrR family transcriptional regulator